MEQAKNNAVLNHLNTIEFIRQNAREYLKMAGEYDVVILIRQNWFLHKNIYSKLKIITDFYIEAFKYET
ncbi:hypothetical protein PGH42_00025 [Legionella pneumophila]|nr:hypothetical protein PGH42_00025 [Legionella pneumophila]